MDLDTVRRVEQIYRNRLRSEPCDTLARVRLAWCLFAQALHEAGRESAYAALRCSNPPHAEELDEKCLPEMERGATSLLDDCLRQTYAALHLSVSRREQQDAAELQALARLISGEAPLARAESWANEILSAMVVDLNQPNRTSGEPFTHDVSPFLPETSRLERPE